VTGGPEDPVVVRRRDDLVGLAVLRASLPPVTLVTSLPGAVLVRTPSRPDFHDGDVVDLEAAPAVDELDRWIGRAATQLAAIGAPLVRLRWQEALPPDAPPVPPAPDPALAAALAARGMGVEPLTVLLLDALASVPPATGVEVLGPLPADGDDALHRRWHGVAVLQRFALGSSTEEWRAWDDGFGAWQHGVRRGLARIGRARAWLALRQGIPVGTVTMVDDGTGLCVVEDLVVHPAHRGRGIAGALEHAAIAAELEARPGARVAVVVEPGSTSDRLQRRLGLRPVATVWTAERALDAADLDTAGGDAGGHG
jgi:GNAT superfamily N-acetyltransferase